MQSYHIEYTTKNKYGYVLTQTTMIMASNMKYALRALRRKTKTPFKVIDAKLVGYY
jgi:hypothetical protein